MDHCKHIFQRGDNRGAPCPRAARESGYCAQHEKRRAAKQSKAVRARAAEREINAREAPAATRAAIGQVFGAALQQHARAAEPAPERQKRRSSLFFITINSNKAYDVESKDTQLLHDLCHWLYEEMEILNFIVDRRAEGADAVELLAERPRTTWRLEVADKGGQRLHCHALLRLWHHGTMRVDLGRLRAFLADVLGYRPYLNVRPSFERTAADNDIQRLEDYIKKGAAK